MFQPDELRGNRRLVWSTGTGAAVWELFCACVAGDLATVERLVQDDPSIVRAHYAYRKPLYFAVRENRIEVAAFLLERDPDPVGLAVYDTLVDIARDRGHAEMVRLLETRLASRHNASARGEPVAAAIRGRSLERVRRLLDESAELLHAGDLRSNQPIHWAALTRQIDIIDELLQRGADINAHRMDGARPIQLANGDYHYRGWRDVPSDVATTPAEVIAHLRARGGYCDISTASHVGDLDRVRQLLDEDPSLAKRVAEYATYYPCSGAPLRNAAGRGHMEIVKLLLARGADPNLPEEGIAPRGHALYAAVANGHHEIAELLLRQGADPSPPVESSADALSIAISNADQRMIDLLRSHGSARSVELLAYYGDVQAAAAVFASDPALADDPRALENAAEEGHDGFVRLMLRYQPGLARRVGVGARTRALTELLFAHGMDPSRPDWLGITPLHRFARQGNLEQAEIFIDRGADLHARDDDIRSTPLGWAAKFGQAPMVRLLLNRGARPNLPDDPPWATPVAWASRRGHPDIVALLHQNGAG